MIPAAISNDIEDVSLIVVLPSSSVIDDAALTVSIQDSSAPVSSTPCWPDPPASSVQATPMSAPAQLDPTACPAKDQQLSMPAPPVKILRHAVLSLV